MRHFISKKTLLYALSLVIVSAAGFVVPSAAYACGSATGTSQQQILYGTGQAGGDCSGSGVTDVAHSVVNILSLVVGIAAIIVLIVSGMRFITSGGESSKVSSAKNGIIYALIGLVVAALAQFLIHYVIFTASHAVGNLLIR